VFACASKYLLYAITALILSPPYQLLIERMNIDVLMFMGLLLSSILYSRNKFKISLAIVALTVLTKFYTLIVLSQYVKVFKKKVLIFFMTFACALTAKILFEYREISEDIPPLGGGAFGAKVFLYWVLKLPSAFIFIATMILIAVSISLYLLTLRRHLIRVGEKPIFSNPAQVSTFKFFTITSFSIYLVGSNWDYRLIFLNVPFLLIMCFSENLSNKLQFTFSFLFLATNYLSFNVAGPLQFAGDISIILSLITFLVLTFSRQLTYAIIDNQ